jgi:hypothetical protein
VSGVATRVERDGPEAATDPHDARLPVAYEGYPLGPVVFGWTTGGVADEVELVMVTTSGEILVRTPMDDLEAARRLAAELWRRFKTLAAERTS